MLDVILFPSYLNPLGSLLTLCHPGAHLNKQIIPDYFFLISPGSAQLKSTPGGPY